VSQAARQDDGINRARIPRRRRRVKAVRTSIVTRDNRVATYYRARYFSRPAWRKTPISGTVDFNCRDEHADGHHRRRCERFPVDRSIGRWVGRSVGRSVGSACHATAMHGASARRGREKKDLFLEIVGPYLSYLLNTPRLAR